MTSTPLLALPELQPSDPLAHIRYNTMQRVLEAMIVGRLVSTSTTAPPGSPAESDMHYVPAAATGAWSGQTGKIAIHIGGTWIFLPLYVGQQFYVVAATARQTWNGTTWA